MRRPGARCAKSLRRCYAAGLLAARQIDLLDLFVDVSFFVSQEGVVFPAPANERFLFQTAQALLNMTPQRQPISVHLVQAEGHEVVYVPLHLLHIANEEEDLEQ